MRVCTVLFRVVVCKTYKVNYLIDMMSASIYPFSTAKTFGLLDAPYCEVRENGTDIQLCVGLKLPYKSIHCPVDFTFYLHLSIISNKEGKLSSFLNELYFNHIFL